MFNAENFARPESELSVDGTYVPTVEDWAEANAHWDAMEVDNAYDPFDDAEASAWEDDAYENEYDYSDPYGAEHEFYEYPE